MRSELSLIILLNWFIPQSFSICILFWIGIIFVIVEGNNILTDEITVLIYMWIMTHFILSLQSNIFPSQQSSQHRKNKLIIVISLLINCVISIMLFLVMGIIGSSSVVFLFYLCCRLLLFKFKAI